MVTVSSESRVHVRPAWVAGSPPLSPRGASLLLREWQELGLLDEYDDDADAGALLRGVQERALTAPVAPPTSPEKPLRLVTTADEGSETAPESAWPEFEGRLLRYGEVAIIGLDAERRAVRERFLPGSLQLPESGAAPVIVNRNHERNKIVGHLTGLRDAGGDVLVRGIVVDKVVDGQEAIALATSGTVGAMSVEFLSLGPPFTKVTREPSGGQLVEHSRVLLVGVGLVSSPAYRSARLLRLLDRVQAGRQQETVRQRAIARIRARTA